jgi:hypothetical protein
VKEEPQQPVAIWTDEELKDLTEIMAKEGDFF